MCLLYTKAVIYYSIISRSNLSVVASPEHQRAENQGQRLKESENCQNEIFIFIFDDNYVQN